MRIILCGPGYKNKFAGFYYSYDKKFLNGLIREGHNVVHFRDRDESRIAHTAVPPIGRARSNLSLLEICEHFRPELVALFHADVVTDATLDAIRKVSPGCRIVNVDCDALIDGHVMKRMVSRGSRVDASFVTTGGEPLARLRAAGVKASYIPNPTDSSMEDIDAFAVEEKSADLMYVSSYGPGASQWAFLEEVTRRAPKVRIIGHGASKRRLLGRAYFEALAAAKCALNWSKYNDVPFYSSDRIAQLFGSGLCVCLPRSIGYQRFLGEDDAVFFSSAADLAQRLTAIIADGSWREIGHSGRDRYRKLFNERRLARYLLAASFGEDVRGYEWSDI